MSIDTFDPPASLVLHYQFFEEPILLQSFSLGSSLRDTTTRAKHAVASKLWTTRNSTSTSLLCCDQDVAHRSRTITTTSGVPTVGHQSSTRLCPNVVQPITNGVPNVGQPVTLHLRVKLPPPCDETNRAAGLRGWWSRRGNRCKGDCAFTSPVCRGKLSFFFVVFLCFKRVRVSYPDSPGGADWK